MTRVAGPIDDPHHGVAESRKSRSADPCGKQRDPKDQVFHRPSWDHIAVIAPGAQGPIEHEAGAARLVAQAQGAVTCQPGQIALELGQSLGRRSIRVGAGAGL